MRKLRPLSAFIAILVLWTGVVFAQEGGLLPGETLSQPKERPVTVSATVPDRIPPPTAILLSPGNNQHVSTGRPAFRWQYSGDTSEITKQQLFIDGVLFQDNLPFASANPSQYALEYQSGTGIFALTHSLTLADGLHTWKIKAFNAEGNSSESATWSFVVDTLAPVFAVTKIVDITTSIWAQDVSTVPIVPIEIPTRNPILTGKGEAGSTVVLTVRLPSGETETHTFTINDMGHWNVQLFDLPRGAVIYLDFMITDVVGHISTLIDLPLIVETITVSIPGIAKPIQIDIPSGLEPVLEPILKPEQIIEKITYNPLEIHLPSSLQTTTQALPVVLQTPTLNLLKVLFSVIGLIIVSGIPVAKILVLLSRIGKQLSLHLFAEILKAIGFLPRGRAHGIVFSVESQEPVSFARVIFQGKTKNGLLHSITKLTNKQGVYEYEKLPEGEYQVAVLGKGHSFPTLVLPPPGRLWNNFYRGEPFEQVAPEYTPSLLIPMDKAEEEHDSLGAKLLRVRARNPVIFLGAVAAAVLLPSAYNLAAALLYVLANLNRKWRDNDIRFTVLDPSGNPLKNTVVRVQVSGEPRLRSLNQTNKSGKTNLERTAQNEKVSLTILQLGYNASTNEDQDLIEAELTEQNVQVLLQQSRIL
ncbi:MAG: hypothetical protein O2840_03075 [bacterium]|nr:hypothetical protein [bacterium]